jgi:hypothetical protein
MEAAKINLSTAQGLLFPMMKNGSRSYEGITNLHKVSAKSCEKEFVDGSGVALLSAEEWKPKL